jgi:parallel beta-helix repeat protein
MRRSRRQARGESPAQSPPRRHATPARGALLALSLAAAIVLDSPPAFAGQVACGTVLTSDTVLERDLTDCPGDGLLIGADDITLDLNGHSITGLGASDGTIGIRNEGHDGVTIKDRDFTGLSVENFEIAVRVQDATGNRLRGLFVEGTALGILLERADRNRVEGNSARGREASICESFARVGILLQESDRNTIRGNEAELSDFGIALLRGSDHNLVHGNMAAPRNSDGNACTGIALVDSDRNDVKRNLAAHNGRDGIFVAQGSGGTLVRDNTAIFNGVGDGLDVADPATTITRNRANANGELGIEAVQGVRDGGGNRAEGNGDPRQCLNVRCR